MNILIIDTGCANLASLHLETTGRNDHHKTESLYKAFGRCLRQALRIEDDRLPSSKGTL